MKTLTLATVLFLFAAGCSSTQPAPSNDSKQGSAITAMAKAGQLATDPIAQMSFEFDGNPPQDEIRDKIDKVLAMYGLEVNKINQGTAGRTLVALRKEHGHSEMSILDKMLSSPAEGKFEDAAARISSAMNQ